MLGYKTAIVEYVRGDRFAGESKYPLSKMLNFAIDGVTSLTSKPIRFVFLAGCIFLLASLPLLIAGIVCAIAKTASAGYLFISFLILLCGGAQLCATGVVGEYVGKTYLETKKRPRYHISDILHTD